MTVAQLMANYMPLRRKLLEARTPLDGWIVYISPHDAADVNLEHKNSIHGAFVYGATWLIDVDVPVGELRVVVKDAYGHTTHWIR